MNSDTLGTHGGLGLSKPTEHELQEIKIKRDEAVEAERKSHLRFHMSVRRKLVYDFYSLHFDPQTDTEEKPSMFAPSRPLSSINAKAELFSQLKFLVNILFRRSQLRSRLEQLKSSQKPMAEIQPTLNHTEQQLSKVTPVHQLTAILPVFYRDPGLDANAFLNGDEKDSLKPNLDGDIFGGVVSFSPAGAGVKKIPLRSQDLSAYIPKYFPELVVDVSMKSREELDACVPPPTPPKIEHQEPCFLETYTPPVMEADFETMLNPVYLQGPVHPYGRHGFAPSSLLASDHCFANAKEESHETSPVPNFTSETSLLIEDAFASAPAKMTRALSEDVLSNSDDEPMEHKSSEKLTYKPVKWAFTPRLNVNKTTCEDNSLSKVQNDARTDLLDHVMYTFSA